MQQLHLICSNFIGDGGRGKQRLREKHGPAGGRAGHRAEAVRVARRVAVHEDRRRRLQRRRPRPRRAARLVRIHGVPGVPPRRRHRRRQSDGTATNPFFPLPLCWESLPFERGTRLVVVCKWTFKLQTQVKQMI